jgi:putative ABC transport system permease protein
MARMLMVIIVVLIMITIVGIFGLTLFNISKRTKQIGTRRALGARKSDIVKYFLVENAMVCIVGLVVGSAGAVYLGTLLLQEYSLPALDNAFILYTAGFVFLISLMSVLVPANRAANISPSIATRSI